MTEDERRAAHLARRGQKQTNTMPKWARKVVLTPETIARLEYVKRCEIDLSGPVAVIRRPSLT